MAEQNIDPIEGMPVGVAPGKEKMVPESELADVMQESIGTPKVAIETAAGEGFDGPEDYLFNQDVEVAGEKPDLEGSGEGAEENPEVGFPDIESAAQKIEEIENPPEDNNETSSGLKGRVKDAFTRMRTPRSSEKRTKAEARNNRRRSRAEGSKNADESLKSRKAEEPSTSESGETQEIKIDELIAKLNAGEITGGEIKKLEGMFKSRAKEMSEEDRIKKIEEFEKKLIDDPSGITDAEFIEYEYLAESDFGFESEEAAAPDDEKSETAREDEGEAQEAENDTSERAEDAESSEEGEVDDDLPDWLKKIKSRLDKDRKIDEIRGLNEEQFHKYYDGLVGQLLSQMDETGELDRDDLEIFFHMNLMHKMKDYGVDADMAARVAKMLKTDKYFSSKMRKRIRVDENTRDDVASLQALKMQTESLKDKVYELRQNAREKVRKVRELRRQEGSGWKRGADSELYQAYLDLSRARAEVTIAKHSNRMLKMEHLNIITKMDRRLGVYQPLKLALQSVGAAIYEMINNAIIDVDSMNPYN